MRDVETVLLNLVGWVPGGPDRVALTKRVESMQPIRHSWRWRAGIGENPRLTALRAEREALREAARKNGPGTGQGAYCLSIALLEEKIREVEREEP